MTIEAPTTTSELFCLGYPYSEVVHAAASDARTLCRVETFGEMTRYDGIPDDKRLCNNCSLIFAHRGTWTNHPFALAWLRKRSGE